MSAPPDYVARASAEKFQLQASAGAEKAYGAVGDFDYVVLAHVWQDFLVDPRPRPVFQNRVPYLSVKNDILRPALGLAGMSSTYSDRPGEGSGSASSLAERASSYSVLDLGTGDGKFLHTLHTELQLPWQNICGVSAEDMRGQRNLDSQQDASGDFFDLHCPPSSYFVGNIDDARFPENLLAHRSGVGAGAGGGPRQGGPRREVDHGRFDLIVSFVTFCWLTDPIGSLLRVFSRLVKPGGLLLVGGVQLLTKELGVEEEQGWLFAFAGWLRERYADEIEQLELVRDSQAGAYVYWAMKKRAGPAGGKKLVSAVDVRPRISDTSTRTSTQNKSQRREVTMDPALSYSQDKKTGLDQDSLKVCYVPNYRGEGCKTVLQSYYDASVQELEGLPSTRIRIAGAASRARAWLKEKDEEQFVEMKEMKDRTMCEQLLRDYRDPGEPTDFRTKVMLMSLMQEGTAKEQRSVGAKLFHA